MGRASKRAQDSSVVSKVVTDLPPKKSVQAGDAIDAMEQLKANLLKLERENKQLKADQQKIERENKQLRSSQAELAELHEAFRQLFELAPIGYFVFDQESLVHDVNLTGINMLQTARRRVLHKPFLPYLNPEDEHQFKQHILHVIETGDKQACDLRLLRKDGSVFYVEIQSILIRNENEDRALVRSVMMDINVRRQMEEELIAEREKALQAARFMNEFLANMSHEIRTPLAGVIGFAEVLEEELPSEHREIAQLIARGGNRLLHTLNSVLDFAKLKAHNHKLVQTPINVVDRVQKHCRLLSALARQQNLTLEYTGAPEPLYALVDPNSLDRILDNLIGNAIKYTPEGTVNVGVYADTDRLNIKIKDTGIGINKEFLPQIFEPFRQEYMGDDRPYEGVGLGLTITKRLVKLMNGNIAVESNQGEGSCFTVSFPLLSNAIDQLVPDEPASPHATKHFVVPQYKMLVVEDNLETQLLVKRLLKPNFEVVLIDSFDAAIVAFTNASFDMVLLDINLGEKRTGTDLLHKLRALPDKNPFYAVAFTAYALPTDRSNFLTQGFDDYLPKPFTRSDLMDLLQRASLIRAAESR